MKIIYFRSNCVFTIRDILDNVLLVQETLNWEKQSNWELVFIKLDFVEAYNTLAWKFMFQAIEAFRVPPSIINTTKLLLKYQVRWLILIINPQKF